MSTRRLRDSLQWSGMSTLSRGRPRKPEIEEAILRSVRELLAERGYPRMCLEEVARRAGVTKPTIYLRWNSKGELAMAALSRIREEEVPAGEGSGKRRLTHLLRQFQSSLLRPHGMALVGTVLAEEAHTPSLLRAFRQHLVAPRRRMLRELLEESRRRGELRPRADLEAAVAMAVGAFYARYLSPEGIPKDWADRVAKVVWASIASAPRRSLSLPTVRKLR
jgi:AcrR family transcriptional regulator